MGLVGYSGRKVWMDRLRIEGRTRVLTIEVIGELFPSRPFAHAIHFHLEEYRSGLCPIPNNIRLRVVGCVVSITLQLLPTGRHKLHIGRESNGYRVRSVGSQCTQRLRWVIHVQSMQKSIRIMR
jgi:hypothetical protein